MSQSRRLAAILAADVAGYSRLMGADEEGTLERLKARRRELLHPKIREHHGRIPGSGLGTIPAARHLYGPSYGNLRAAQLGGMCYRSIYER